MQNIFTSIMFCLFMDDMNNNNMFSPENYYDENNNDTSNNESNEGDNPNTNLINPEAQHDNKFPYINTLKDFYNNAAQSQNDISIYPGPSQESTPLANANGYSRVKFLNAAVNYPPFRILIGNKVYLDSISYGNLSDYATVPSGFRKVTIASTKVPRTVFYSQTLPFVSGNSYTMAIVNNPNGIEIIPINNYKCSQNAMGLACIRMANLSHTSCPLDLVMYDGTTIFSDVRFKQVTPFKKITPGGYNFYITNTLYLQPPESNNIESLSPSISAEELMCLSEYEYGGALTSFYIDVAPNKMYTAYAIGLLDSTPYLRTIIVAD